MVHGADKPTVIEIESTVLKEKRTVLVRTPAGYERKAERYPVLYMTDGEANLYHTSETIKFLAGMSKIPEMIIVVIENIDRVRDLTPTPIETTDPAWKSAGGADNFLRFIETELIPAIEKRYRTVPYRVFAGHSQGGLFALHALLSKPELFNAYIAVSPVLQWDKGVMLQRTETFLKSHPDLKKTLFLSLGNEPSYKAHFDKCREVLKTLAPPGLEWDSVEYSDEDHGSVILPATYAGLKKIFAGWEIPTDAQGRIVGGLEKAEEYYQELSKRFGYTIKVPESVLSRIGYRYSRVRRPEDALRAFNENAKRYPHSHRVYANLAYIHDRMGNLDLSIRNYRKAIAIAKGESRMYAEYYRKTLAETRARLQTATKAKKNAEEKPSSQSSTPPATK